MNYNVKRHKLLELLSNQNINVQLEKPGFMALGVSYEEIYSKLNLTDFQLLKLTSELYENKEIGYHNAYDIEGLYAENKGISAFSNKKYLKLYRKGIIEYIKDIIQILIPVLSVIIAFLALTIKIQNVNSENEEHFKDIRNEILLMDKKNEIKLNSIKNNLNNSRKEKQ
jgi:hypothetical protein